MRETVAHGSLGRWSLPLLLAVVLVGALLRIAAVQHHTAIDYDEGRYLDNAVNILEGRGLATHYTSHFFRDAPPLHPEDISSPLHPYLLAGTFLLTGPDHRAAQMWSLIPGCLLIALTFRLGRRFFDEHTALLASILVALNPDNVILSSWSMTEMLYATMVMGLLLLADSERLSAAALPGAVALGAACGLLYLERANGLGVAAAMVLAALLGRRPAAAAAILAAFLAVVSPWLVRNEKVFGSPTWTAMKHVAWSESGRDLFTRDASPPSPAGFRAEHGTAGLARNLLHRGWRATRYLVWGDTGAYNLLCAAYPLALVALWRRRRLLAGHMCVLMTTLLLAGVPIWTGALSRYLSPVRPFMYLCAIGALMHVAPSLIWKRRIPGVEDHRNEVEPRSAAGRPAVEPFRRQTILAVATLVAVIALVSTRPLREFMSADEAGRDALAREAAGWIAEQTPPGSVLLEGAWVHQYAYRFDRAVVWVPAGGLDETLETAAHYGADYLVMSGELLRFRPELRPHFEETNDGIRAIGLPAGVTEVFAGAGRRIVIYRVREVDA